jgi:hypothetical protein
MCAAHTMHTDCGWAACRRIDPAPVAKFTHIAHTHCSTATVDQRNQLEVEPGSNCMLTQSLSEAIKKTALCLKARTPHSQLAKQGSFGLQLRSPSPTWLTANACKLSASSMSQFSEPQCRFFQLLDFQNRRTGRRENYGSLSKNLESVIPSLNKIGSCWNVVFAMTYAQ